MNAMALASVALGVSSTLRIAIAKLTYIGVSAKLVAVKVWLIWTENSGRAGSC